MVLQIGDKFVDGKIDLPNLYSRHPELVSSGAKFASIPCRSLQVGLELVSKELNHLAAILHVYAGGLNFIK